MSDESQSEGTILAIDNVPLDLPIAGAASRSLSAFLDYLIVGALSIVWLFAGVMVGASLRPGGWFLAVLLLGLFVIDYGYFAGVEVATGGRTFGKWALGLAVVTRTGGRPGPAALLIRNVLRAVDLLLAVPLMAMDPLARRLGDRLAGTLVVHTRQDRESEMVAQRIPRGWSGREVGVAESFLRRARDLEPARAQRMALQILALIERDDPALVAAVAPGPDAVATLRGVLQPDGAE